MVSNVTNTSSTSNIGSSIVNSITGGTIDIQSLADNLTNATKAPRQALLDTRKQVADSKISSIGRITSSANDFKTALSALGDPRSLGLTPQSSDINAADFSYQSFVSPKSVNLSFVVKQLATANTVTLPPIASNSALVGTEGADQGIITIRKTDGTVIDSINFSSTQTLSDLAESINNSASANKTGITATILNGAIDSNGAYPQNLILSNGTGEINNFKVEINYKQNGSDFQNSASGLTLNSNADFNKSFGTDAIIATGPYRNPDSGKIEFQNTFSSSTNKFSNLISGVNINVHQVTADNAPVTLTSEFNNQGLLSALQTIVSGYNSLLATAQNEIKYDLDVTKRGGLANDSIARSFLSQLRQLTTKQFPDGNGNTYSLADIGVKTNTSDGTLSIDMNVVSQAQQNRPEIFAAVLTSKPAKKSDGTNWSGPTGAIDQMITLNNIVVGTSSDFSMLLNKTKNSDEQSISDDQKKLDSEMEAMKARYLSQFTAMQSLLDATKANQSSLTNMMSSWTAAMKN